MGAAARVMMNHGVRDLVLVAPRCEPLDGKARAMAAGAAEILRRARVVPDLPAALALAETSVALTGKGGRLAAFDCVGALPTELLRAQAPPRRVALVFGREDQGLTNEELLLCPHRWRLPTDIEFPSLNLAQAIAIALAAVAEAERSLGRPAPDPEAGFTEQSLLLAASPTAADRPATWDEQDRIVAAFREAMHGTGYEPGARTERSLSLVRNVLSRVALTHREAQLLRGIMRHALWRIHRNEDDASGQ